MNWPSAILALLAALAGPAPAADPNAAATPRRAASAAETAAELRQLMAELAAMRVSAGPQRPAAARAEEPNEPPATQPATRPAAEPTTRPTRPPPAPLPPELVARLKDLSASALADPASLADELYAGGHVRAAAVLYERAAAGQTDPNGRAWAVFQAANCLRGSDARAAETMYERVVKEHASSPWAVAAVAELKALGWMRTSGMTATLAAARKEAISAPTTRPVAPGPAGAGRPEMGGLGPATRPTTAPAGAAVARLEGSHG